MHRSMKAGFAAAAILAMVTWPAFARNDNNNDQGDNQDGFRGVPGPLLAAGLPALVIVGGGYWVIRRFRRKTD